jgi:hypothetical protein
MPGAALMGRHHRNDVGIRIWLVAPRNRPVTDRYGGCAHQQGRFGKSRSRKIARKVLEVPRQIPPVITTISLQLQVLLSRSVPLLAAALLALAGTPAMRDY